VLSSCEKEGSCRMQLTQSGKVDVPFVHDVICANLYLVFSAEDIKHIDIEYLAAADLDKTWNRSFQIYQRMQFDSCFASAKWRPNENDQKQFHSRRIQSIKNFAPINDLNSVPTGSSV